MAHEITPWREPNCDLLVRIDSITSREPYSREINKKYGEGGGLNANYQTVEAVAIISSILAANGLRYGTHWVFKTAGDYIYMDFYDKSTLLEARGVLLGSHATLSKPVLE